jgi:hypothetical protein
MHKPIPDKAEVALEYPAKLYIGTFERSSQFEAHLDKTGIALTLTRHGSADDRKSVHIHFHYGLFADILADLAKAARAAPFIDDDHCVALRNAALALERALKAENDEMQQIGDLSPKEEVLLLHVLE